jgi:hypothetical protein
MRKVFAIFTLGISCKDMPPVLDASSPAQAAQVNLKKLNNYS